MDSNESCKATHVRYSGEFNTKRITYARLIYDETNFRSKVVEVNNRNIDEINFPDEVSSFYFFDMITFQKEIDGKKIKFTSDEFNLSTRYFYGGKIITREEYLQMYPDSNMRYEIEQEFCRARLKFSVISFLKEEHIFIPR